MCVCVCERHVTSHHITSHHINLCDYLHERSVVRAHHTMSDPEKPAQDASAHQRGVRAREGDAHRFRGDRTLSGGYTEIATHFWVKF